jgi:hypothetical protein
MKYKIGQDPAFPPTREMQELSPTCQGYHVGMNKRFYAACAAMQGLIASGHKDLNDEWYARTIFMAYKFADELLKQENL